MKVLLQRVVDKLGVPGDVVSVADGYARNYLMPRGLAVAASKGAVQHAESLKRAHSERVAKELDAARAMAERLESLPLVVRTKAGEDGRLFGSVTAADIAEAITAASGGEIGLDRKDIHMDDSVRTVGVHPVKVRLHHEVEAEIQVTVEATY